MQNLKHMISTRKITIVEIFSPLCHSKYGSMAVTKAMAAVLFNGTEFRHALANEAATVGVAGQTVSQDQCKHVTITYQLVLWTFELLKRYSRERMLQLQYC